MRVPGEEARRLAGDVVDDRLVIWPLDAVEAPARDVVPSLQHWDDAFLARPRLSLVPLLAVLHLVVIGSVGDEGSDASRVDLRQQRDIALFRPLDLLALAGAVHRGLQAQEKSLSDASAARQCGRMGTREASCTSAVLAGVVIVK